MLGSGLRLAAVALIALGLVFSPMGLDTSSAKSKSKTVASKKDKKKDSKKKDSKKKDKKSKSKSDKKSVKGKKSKSDKKSKKDKRAKNDSRSSKRSRSRDDDREGRATKPSTNTHASSRAIEPVAAKRSGSNEPNYVSSGGESSDETEEPDLPKPANRVVADMSSTRVVEIQTALIKQGFLAGPANGVYDQPTFAAMQAFQSRNGWNPVGVPTADSLKKLGVPKNSGRAYPSPSRVVDETATDRP